MYGLGGLTLRGRCLCDRLCRRTRLGACSSRGANSRSILYRHTRAGACTNWRTDSTTIFYRHPRASARSSRGSDSGTVFCGHPSPRAGPTAACSTSAALGQHSGRYSEQRGRQHSNYFGFHDDLLANRDRVDPLCIQYMPL